MLGMQYTLHTNTIPCLVTVIHRQSVAIAQAKVTSLPEGDDSITVTIALVIHSHPVGPIGTIGNDSLQHNTETGSNTVVSQCHIVTQAKGRTFKNEKEQQNNKSCCFIKDFCQDVKESFLA